MKAEITQTQEPEYTWLSHVLTHTDADKPWIDKHNRIYVRLDGDRAQGTFMRLREDGGFDGTKAVYANTNESHDTQVRRYHASVVLKWE